MKYKNNPANIRSGSNWLGLSGNNNGFCEFIDLSMGVRALLYILFKYYRVYHLTSVKDIISRFAPPSENDTDSYIKYVNKRISNSLGYDSREQFITLIAQAICYYETSTEISCYYIRSVIEIFSYQFPK